MALAFLILAHRAPTQVARLFAAMHHPEDTWVLHFDRRSPAALHALGARLAARHANVHVMAPRAILWGGPVMAEVQIAALDWLCDKSPTGPISSISPVRIFPCTPGPPCWTGLIRGTAT
jgi:hypothetical protein